MAPSTSKPPVRLSFWSLMSAKPKDARVAAPPSVAIRARIQTIREIQVMLDEDLAKLYGVETKALTRAVRRNTERFPSDFMFQLTDEEFADLRRQAGASSGGHGGRRYPPLAFTEHGVAMLSSVLRTKRAAVVNIEIVRAFVEMRRMAASNRELEKRIADLEETTSSKFGEHEKHLAALFRTLRELTTPKPRHKHPIGFSPPDEN